MPRWWLVAATLHVSIRSWDQGTTLIAADKLGRRCLGMELDPRYVDLATAEAA
jgi:DNA modification methylase